MTPRKLTKQQQLIADLRRAVRESKAAARSVAQIVSRRVRKEVGTDLVEIMGKREFDAIVRQIEEATARQEVEKPLQRIAEVVTDLEIKRLQKVVDDFSETESAGRRAARGLGGERGGRPNTAYVRDFPQQS